MICHGMSGVYDEGMLRCFSNASQNILHKKVSFGTGKLATKHDNYTLNWKELEVILIMVMHLILDDFKLFVKFGSAPSLFSLFHEFRT